MPSKGHYNRRGMLGFLFVIAVCIVFTGGLVAIGEAHRRRPDYPECRACGYNLTGVVRTAAFCPECGIGLSYETVRPPRQIRLHGKRLAYGIGLLILALLMTCVGLQ